MQRQMRATDLRPESGEWRVTPLGRRGLRLATPSGNARGPEKYRMLDLKRRRAQIRARRELGLG